MRVPYHIGSQNEFSLAFVGDDEDALHRWKENASEWRLEHIEAPDDTQLALAYTPSRSRPSDDDTVTVTDWSEGTATLAYAYLSAFNGIESQADLQENKSFDAGKVERALERVQWRQTVPEVAGELWSNLVLAHPLPNANHRSALALTSLYLQSQDNRATLGGYVATSSETADSVNDFFATSKRLLTVRRNAVPFRILSVHGVKEVERKGDIIIPLDEYDLSVENAYQTYADAHREASVEFIRTYLSEAGLRELVSEEDNGKNAVVQTLRRQ